MEHMEVTPGKTPETKHMSVSSGKNPSGVHYKNKSELPYFLWEIRDLLPPVLLDRYYPFGPMPQITVEIPNTPLRFPLTAKSTDTIGAVRKGVVDKCFRLGKSYITERMFVLVFNTHQLKDDSATLSEIGVRRMGSTLLFERASFHLCIVAPECELSTNVDVRCYDTVGMLKERLKDVTGIPRGGQQLKYRDLDVDWFLDDDGRLLVDYGISKQYKYDVFFFPQEPELRVASSKRGLNVAWDF